MPSENIRTSTPPAEPGDRRTRKRRARRDALLEIAAELVERDGVAGVTMAALADAADYAPASLYTYFASRSALLAALQQRALEALADVAEEALGRWDADLSARDGVADDVAALARLWAFSDLFLAAPEQQRHRDERDDASHSRIPAMVAVMNAASVPAIMARMPSVARSERRSGAMPLMPPI